MANPECLKVEADSLLRQMTQHAPALQLYARQWCDCAEDVVQESLFQLSRLPTRPDNPLGWLYRVVRNRSISACRSNGRRRRYESQAAAEQETWFVDGSANAIDSQLAASLLSELPENQREVLVAHLWGGLTFAQIGELAGCSASTAHRRYEAGLSTLRDRLRGHDD